MTIRGRPTSIQVLFYKYDFSNSSILTKNDPCFLFLRTIDWGYFWGESLFTKILSQALKYLNYLETIAARNSWYQNAKSNHKQLQKVDKLPHKQKVKILYQILLIFWVIATFGRQNSLHTIIYVLLCIIIYKILMQGKFDIWFSPKQCHLPPPPKNSSFNCTVCWPVEGTIEEKMESLKETMIDLWTKSCSNVQDSVVSLTFYQGESCSLYIVMKLIRCAGLMTSTWLMGRSLWRWRPHCII